MMHGAYNVKLRTRTEMSAGLHVNCQLLQDLIKLIQPSKFSEKGGLEFLYVKRSTDRQTDRQEEPNMRILANFIVKTPKVKAFCGIKHRIYHRNQSSQLTYVRTVFDLPIPKQCSDRRKHRSCGALCLIASPEYRMPQRTERNSYVE